MCANLFCFAWGFCQVILLFGGGMPDPGSDDEHISKKPPKTIAETITVTAERTPIKIKESTAKVTVIDDEQIRERLVNDVRDLVKYEPGVYVDRDGTRFGLNGFNIRGIGGNRVLTRVDGVRTAEQFDFGPIAVHQYFVDVDTLKSVEIVRSASSSLYGGDALGGVVSFVTKDPIDYLSPGGKNDFRLKSGYDGKDQSYNVGLSGAFSKGRFQGLVTGVARDYGARDNQGRVNTFDLTRTKPNKIDGRSVQILSKGVWHRSAANRLRLTAELFDNEADTRAYSQQGLSNIFGIPTDISQSIANDVQRRFRLSLDQEWGETGLGMFDNLRWKVYAQDNRTEQRTSEQRVSMAGSETTRVIQSGTVDFDQDGYGGEFMLQKRWIAKGSDHVLTYGAGLDYYRFSQIRDRRDYDLDTGNPDAYEGPLIFPTRYFPNSDATQLGIFFQSESYFLDGDLKIIPGARYDRYELSPNKNDEIFLTSTGTSETPVSLQDDALSPKLGVNWEIDDHFALSGHYARGFRAPPYSSVNSGFTNVAGGYQTLPSPDLEPERSDNFEAGFKAYSGKGSFSVAYFDNRYEDFIDDAVFIGVSNTGLALFQPQNVENVTISGLEIAGDYHFTPSWRLRLSFADTRGENTDAETPINSIQPRQGVLGLMYRASSGRFGGELTATFTAAKRREDVVAASQPPFLSDGYNLLDLTFFYNISRSFSVFVGGFNLTDETYFAWSDVRGRSTDDPAIDRYSAPGRNISLNLSYQW